MKIRKPIPVESAVEIMMHDCRILGEEEVPLSEAYGRILIEPIIARHDVPPFNRSVYDGYAIRARDSIYATVTTPTAFTVIGEIGAGHVAKIPLKKAEAYRIMTGALLPENADAIVMLEDTVETEVGFSITKQFSANQNISFQGEDVVSGEVLVKPGATIHPGTVALLATFGYATVKVAKKPRVSLVSTGTELLAVADELQAGKIRDSNGPMIEAQLSRMALSYKTYGVVADDFTACVAVIEEALKCSDVVLTTGGVSVGDYDYLPAIYEQLGAEVLFDKVMMRPGSVTTVARLGDKLLFGLSGNPSACFTGFELFSRPALLKMMGSSTPYLPQMTMRLGEKFPQPNPFTQFIRSIWQETEAGPVVISAGFNKTNAVSSIARGNCIIVLPPTETSYQSGEAVTVLLLGQEQGVSELRLT